MRRIHYGGPADYEEVAANLRREFGAFKEVGLLGLGPDGDNYAARAVLPPPARHAHEA